MPPDCVSASTKQTSADQFTGREFFDLDFKSSTLTSNESSYHKRKISAIESQNAYLLKHKVQCTTKIVSWISELELMPRISKSQINKQNETEINWTKD